MNTIDMYRITNQLDDTILDALVTRMEARGKHPRFIEMMNEYFSAMHIDSAKRVLDLGCGTGVASRALAGRPGFSGHVTGVDLSPYLVAEAKRLAKLEGVAERIDFEAGDSQRLRYSGRVL